MYVNAWAGSFNDVRTYSLVNDQNQSICGLAGIYWLEYCKVKLVKHVIYAEEIYNEQCEVNIANFRPHF